MAEGFFDRRSNSTTKAEMSFVDHLEELRWHLVRSLIAILVLAIFIWINVQWIYDNIIAGPINPNFISYTAFCRFSHWIHAGDALCLPPVEVNMQTTTFGGQFLGSFTIAFTGGLMLAFPYIFWEFWRFVKPALKPKEIQNTRFIIFWVSFFFFLGGTFGYLVLAPFTFNFLSSFSISTINMLVTKPTLTDYLDNLTNIILGCGIAFEMPVISYALTKIGLITPGLLRSSRKYAVVVILVVAAVITPSPDWISQTIVFIPMFLLYEFGVFVSARAYKADQKRDAEEWS